MATRVANACIQMISYVLIIDIMVLDHNYALAVDFDNVDTIITGIVPVYHDGNV